MFSAAFIFEPGTYDERFMAPDASIEAAALATPGYLGRETWQSEDGKGDNAFAHITPNDRTTPPTGDTP